MTNLSGMMSTLVNTASLGSNNHNYQMRDIEVVHSLDNTISSMAFSPTSITQANYLIAGSWDNQVRCWEIQSTGNSIPKQQQTMTASVMDVAWSAVIYLFYSYILFSSWCMSFTFRMEPKCSWLDMTIWPNAGIYLPTNASRYYNCFLIV